MNEHDKKERETETILMALDQISQTIDVMTSVVGRLRTHLHQQEREAAAADPQKEQKELQAQMRPDRILH